MTASYFVADTNIWIRQFLNPNGPASAALSKALERHTPVFDRDTFEELRTRLEKPKLIERSTPALREEFLQAVVESAVFIDRTHEVQRSRDPDDDKFLELAMTIGARNLISSDVHLREIKHYQGVQIWSPEQFLQLERARKPIIGLSAKEMADEVMGRDRRQEQPKQEPEQKIETEMEKARKLELQLRRRQTGEDGG